MAASVGGDDLEVNLTPLLDLVLQLIMFFMACINFVSEQVSLNVMLPVSASTQEIQPKSEDDVLFINIEVKRQPKRVNGQEVVDPKTFRPVMEVAEPKTTIINIFGGEVISFTERSESLGLFKAQRRLNLLAKAIKQRTAEKIRDRGGRVPADVRIEIPVVIRADVQCRTGLVAQLIAQCKKEGFPKVELRAQMVKDE
jgi:biopolymer transport protein ExbD